MVRDIIIYGAGGHGREVLQVVHAINRVKPTWRCLGFVVDPSHAGAAQLHDLPVFTGIESVPNPVAVWLTIAIGDPFARQRIVERLANVATAGFAVLVHPQAGIGDRVRLGQGCIVCGGAMITTDILLHSHVHVNSGATIAHDAEIGAYTSISPGVNVSGRVMIGECVFIGTGASLINGITVGDGCVIGAGAAVIRSLPAGATAVGVPAQIIRMREA